MIGEILDFAFFSQDLKHSRPQRKRIFQEPLQLQHLDFLFVVSSNAMISVITVLKILLQLALFLVFLFDYGLPSIYKYLEKKTIRTQSRKETGGIEAPSITVAGWTPGTNVGWLNESKDIVHAEDSLRHQCKGFGDIVKCIRNQTYEQSELIKDIVIGVEDNVSLLTSTNTLVEDFTNVRFGRTYTLNPERRIGPIYEKDEIIFWTPT